MEPPLLESVSDKLDMKPSFRKPTSDAASRKYRHHSPVGRSDSASSGSPRRERSRSPLHPKEDRTRTSDDQRRKDAGRELERVSIRNRSSRGHESQKHSERHPYGNSHDYRRRDDYSWHDKHIEEDKRNYQRSSRSGREPRNDSHFDYTKSERTSDRYQDNWRTVDDHSKDKTEISENKNKIKERESVKDYDRADSSKQVGLGRDYDSEQDKRRDRESRDFKKDYHRSPISHKNNQVASHEEFRRYEKDSTLGRDTGARQQNDKTIKKDYRWQEDLALKRKHNEKEGDKHREKYIGTREEFQTERSLFSHRERDGKNKKNVDKASDLIVKQNPSSRELKAGHSEHTSGDDVDEVPSSGSRQVKATHEKVNSEAINSTTNAEAINDVNSAKVAAMKAAELVNKNLVGFGGVGCLSSDQKKKLLWGNKKHNSSEESSSRWDLHLFSDQERQEKFNRLMSLRLPLWLWPIVGCEGQCDFREQPRQDGWKPPSKETGGPRYRSGEAIYCWAPAKRRSNSWSWVVMTHHYSLHLLSDASQTSMVNNFTSLLFIMAEQFHVCF